MTCSTSRARLGDGIGVHMHDVADLDEALLAVASELQDSNPGRLIGRNVAIGATIRCDRARMQQLASNLLSNALTHGSPSRPVEFAARVEGGELVLDVANEGAPTRPKVCRRSSNRSGAIRRRRPAEGSDWAFTSVPRSCARTRERSKSGRRMMPRRGSPRGSRFGRCSLPDGLSKWTTRRRQAGLKMA